MAVSGGALTASGHISYHEVLLSYAAGRTAGSQRRSWRILFFADVEHRADLVEGAAEIFSR